MVRSILSVRHLPPAARLVSRVILATALSTSLWSLAAVSAAAPEAESRSTSERASQPNLPPQPAAVTAEPPTQAPPPPPPPPHPAQAREPAKPRAAATPKPAPPPPPPPPAEPMGQPVNVRVELTLTDQRAGAQPARKTVTVIAADRSSGMVRSESVVTGIGGVQLHVDAEPRILPDGKIRLRFGLQYNSPPPLEKGLHSSDRGGPEPGAPAGSMPQAPVAMSPLGLTTQVKENLALVLENGKPVLATQSADPVNDRQVTVEVKATIMK